MRSILKTGMLVAMLAAMPIVAQAGTLEGVAIGVGGMVASNDVVAYRDGDSYRRHHRHHRHCWINDSGYRHCAWR